MKKHICRQCGSTFEYCRGCLLSPILHKDEGFCSKECYEASKIEIPEKVEVKIPTIETEEVFVEDDISEEEISIEEVESDESQIEYEGIHE